MSKLVIFLVAFAYFGLWWKTTLYARDIASLKPGEQLASLDQLCSASSTYCLSFTGMGDGRTYLATNDMREGESSESVVLVFNRDEPLPGGDDSAALTLDHSGVLQITHPSREPIILYSSSAQPQDHDINNTAATLLDSGNFVLQQLHPDGSNTTLWQSFDYPTDTLLPGMKLGVKHKTVKNWSLVSYIDYRTTPASGAFSLEWEPKRGQLVIKRREQIYWASGELRNNKFENISEKGQSMYNYTVVSNEDEDSITFTARNSQYSWKLFGTGLLSDKLGNDIARADECYGYNNDGGCQRWNVPTCRQVDFQFVSMSIRVKDTENINTSIDSAANSTYSDCQAACWSNCDCVGFTYLYSNRTGCYLVYAKSWQDIHNGNESFTMIQSKFQSPPQTSPDSRDNPIEQGRKVNASTKKWKWIIAIIVIALFMICACILWLVRKRRKLMLEVAKKGTRTQHTILHIENSDGSEDTDENQDSITNGHDLRLFSYASIMDATSGFSSTNKLGEGGFGSVYKGILMRKEVAVKRLSRSSRQGVSEFKNELKLVSELQHMNLVQLLGCCIDKDERILIYEYMPNKSLDYFLFDSTQSKQLDWKKRLQIIEGIAQGLLYLHKYSRLRIVHRDLKASNILLDGSMNPKISDFGMARIFMQESEENTTRIVGTYGYMPPEYAMNGVFSKKLDVYSFGVLMLEIVSGRRNNSFNNASYPITLVGHAWELWKEGLALELMDPAIRDSFVQDQLLRCIHVGLLCVEEYAADRPTMSEILSMLTNSHEMLPLLKKPAFYFGGRGNAANESPKHHKTDSINGMSISDFTAR